jgi:flagellar FliJ protein
MAKHFPIKTLINLAEDELDAATQSLGRSSASASEVEAQLNSLVTYRDEYHSRFTTTAQSGMPAATCATSRHSSTRSTPPSSSSASC